MALLFYATNYSPARAQAEIQQSLLGIGARRISLEYRDKQVVGMSFTLETPQGEREFLLPARVERVLDTLKRQGVLRGAGRRPDVAVQHQHAMAVAWRTLLEWVKVQAAIAETRQAAADEIMLPYLVLEGDGPGQRITLYEQFSANRALPEGGRG